MSVNNKILFEIRYLISRSLGGEITEEEVRRLDRMIIEDPQVRRYYIEFLQTHIHLRKLLEHISSQAQGSADTILDVQLWEQLAYHEKTAELVAVQRERPPAETPKPEEPARAGRPRVSRFSLAGIAVSIAAMLFIVVYAHLFSSPVVATLTDAVQARWAYSQTALHPGDRISTRPRDLVSGFISVRFDSGAEIVLEGPAQFKLLSENQMRLISGKVFASVPNTAIGFTIDCPGSRVVDLGTEFGLEVKPSVNTEVHVMKGKVNLVAGIQGMPQVSEILQSSQACRVEAGGIIKPAEFKEWYFARKISSQEQTVWYGQTHLDVASLIAGGSGKEPSRSPKGIDPASGQIHSNAQQGYTRYGSGGYQTLAAHPFVDGVFVPDGKDGPVQVSSAGHAFSGFPWTSGAYWADIMTQPVIYTGQGDDNQELLKAQPMQVSLEPFSIPSSVLVLHSNAGITFDLDALRRQYPALEIVRFTARCGVSANALAQMAHDFWVLVDGQVRFRHANRHEQAEVKTIDIQIRPHERFLTLAVTDGGDGTSYDWCLFEQPLLELRGKY